MTCVLTQIKEGIKNIVRKCNEESDKHPTELHSKFIPITPHTFVNHASLKVSTYFITFSIIVHSSAESLFLLRLIFQRQF